VNAIDGPAGSGKSTVARRVAAAQGLDYLDTGAMYRSVAFAALDRGVDVSDAEAIGKLAESLDIVVTDVVLVDGVDATEAIRTAEVTRTVSAVAANPAVRQELVRRQRAWAEARGGGVVEGRDIGSVVFPDAQLKVYLTASDEERARRRSAEIAGDVTTVAADIARRDTIDSTRAASPLTQAPDAIVIDTTGRDIDAVVQEVLSKL
jgi:cytidylate kinase